MNVQIGTPRVMLTPDREGIEITLVIHEGPRFKIRQLKIYERDNDGKEIEPLGGRRALRQLVRAQRGDYFNRAELVKDLAGGPHALPRRRLRQRRGRARDRARSRQARGRHHHPDPPRPARPRRAHRDQGQHEDARQGPPSRDGDRGRPALLARRSSRISKRASSRSATSSASTSRPSRARRPTRSSSTSRSPSGRPARSRSAPASRSIENFIATAQIQQANLFGNGQSLALAGAGLRPPAARLASASSSRTSSTPTGRSSVELYDKLFVFPDFARRSLGGSLTFGYALVQPWLRLGVTGTAQHDTVDTSAGRTRSSGRRSGFVSVFQRLPLANLFNAGRTISLRPAITLRHAQQPPLPVVRHLPPGVDGARDRARSAARSSSSATSFIGRFYYPLFGAGRAAGLRLRPQAEHQGRHHHEPARRGRADLRALLPRRHPRRPRLPPAHARPAPAAQRVARRRTRRRSRTARTSAATSQAYSNLELEFPIIDKVGIRGVVFVDAGNAWNTEQQFCKTTPAPQFSTRSCSPCFDARQPRAAPHVDRLRHPLVLAARPAALRVGLPAATRSRYEEAERLRVHDRQLLLSANPAFFPRFRDARHRSQAC